MIFPSYIFLLVFLPIILVIWLSRLPLTSRLGSLTIASYIFYGWWDYRFVGLLLLSTIIDYYCGKNVHTATTQSKKKTYLWISITANLTILGFFKYANFFSQSLATALQTIGVTAEPMLLTIILPVGISFYTFQSMSYALDIYREKATPAPNFLSFSAYVALFPQLVAGPIVRYQELSDQFQKLDQKRVSLTEFSNGIWFFVLGLSKKLLIADALAPIADRLFDGTGLVKFGTAWIGSLAYTLQLYFDFSGYSDMAVGLGLMLGFYFPINFLSPYKSRSIQDFWNRWHITLSHFLRDYLYIPLGGNRAGRRKTLRNLAIVMTLGGLWHGAQWTFVVWGIYHGALLIGHAVSTQLTEKKLPNVIAIPLTFISVMVGWVLFRAPNFERAGEILKGGLGLNGSEPLLAFTIHSETFGTLPAIVDIMGGPERLPFFLLGLLIVFGVKNTHELSRSFSWQWAVGIGLLTVACLSALGRNTPFIYFQF